MRSLLVFHFIGALIFLILGTSADGVPKRKLKILIDNPAMAFSHMQFQGRLADVLAEAGHEVHVLMLDIDPKMKDYNASTKIHKLMRIPRPKDKTDELEKMSGLRNPFLGMFNFGDMWMDFMTMWKDICRELTHNRELMDQLTAERYDVAISEFYQFCSFAVFHRIGVKTKIGSLAIHLNNLAGSHFGIPMVSSYTPNMMAPLIDGMNLGFFDRTIKFYYDLYEANVLSPSYIHMHEPIVRQAFGQDFPPLKEIARNTSLIFTNANEVFEFPKPISNKVVYIGGIVQSKLKPLAENLKSILENSKKGAVLFSLGSVTDTTKMTDKLKQSFITTFAKFPGFDFIWKIKVNQNDTKLFSSLPNIHVVDWVDQKTLLTHPKLVAFISHCGQNSLSEAAHSGVPLVGIPLFGDQVFNAALMKHKGIGEYVDIKTAEDPEVITQALEKVLNDPKYRENVKSIQKKLELAPFKPEEKFVKWVEFAAEFPDLNELNLPTVEEMGVLAYYSLDVIFVSIFVFVVSLYVVAMAFRKLLHLYMHLVLVARARKYVWRSVRIGLIRGLTEGALICIARLGMCSYGENHSTARLVIARADHCEP
ncbi:UDP-glucoronosyl and UDP-glucosyl transferase domain-containing protein [Ditylenchus destructor]|uniref:glucuronosyltransferase n=1 Tax=Ditylenchus destructor TaxID=166010 RepID=A0AAD4R1J8_9BILA|nr:UDP-glucoronosyl and UDP-glucosyl transferase domain-containing protein [Ditylenchus destructor]